MQSVERNEHGMDVSTAIRRFCNWVQDEEWDQLEQLISNQKSAIESHDSTTFLSFLAKARMVDGDSILHMLSTCESVPLNIFKDVIRIMTITGDSLSSVVNDYDQTVLHVATIYIPTRPDIIQEIIAADLGMAVLLDSRDIRPVDSLGLKIIMNEEREKYVRSAVKWSTRLWMTAKVLACAMLGIADVDSMPMVHACLAVSTFPFALKQRVVTYNRDQLLEQDGDGNVPLHIAARERVVYSPDDDEDNYDLLYQLLRICSGAAQIVNHQQKTPLDVAIDVGLRGWNSGVISVLAACPNVLERRRMDPRLYPLLFERLAAEGKVSLLFSLIRMKPGVYNNR